MLSARGDVVYNYKMTTYIILGIISGMFCVLAYIPYLFAMYKNKIAPHPLSWFLWTILGFVSLVTYIGVGAKETLPLAIVSFVGPFLIFILTIKYWKGGFSKFDYICLTF